MPIDENCQHKRGWNPMIGRRALDAFMVEWATFRDAVDALLEE